MGSEQDFDDDALASDDSRVRSFFICTTLSTHGNDFDQLERVVAQSLRNRSIVRPVESAISGPSGSRTSGRSHGKSKSSILKKSIKEIDNKISQLQKERDNLYIELEEELKAERDNKNVSLPVANGKGKGKTTINYDRSDFAWSGALKDRLLKVFGHQNFRPEQEA